MTDEPPMAPETVLRMLISAIPWVGGSALVAYDDQVRWRRLKEEVALRSQVVGQDLIGSIARETGDDRLLRRLREDPLTEALFVNSVDAALRTGLKAKRQLLARVVAQTVNDNTKLDESQLISEALRDLDVPHIRFLRRMRDEWEAEGQHDEVNFGSSDVFKHAPPPIRAALVRTGAARDSGGPYTAIKGRHRQRGITKFGLAIVEMLEREGLEQLDEPTDYPPPRRHPSGQSWD